jgi:membrane-bound serine protease (ClpP class)
VDTLDAMPPMAARALRTLLLVAVAIAAATTATAGVAGSTGAVGTVGAGTQDDRRVLLTTVGDTIGPVIADHLGDGVGRAERGGYQAYVLVLDTPGGLETSMRSIIQRFLDADAPVVVYVAPSGARAASAGALITLSAHVAAMAPGTTIGAATPVGLEGGDVEAKIINDAVALAEAIAAIRDRDVEFAVDAVRDGRAESADTALEVGAVDLVVGSLDDLLEEIDGTEVEVRGGRTVVLETAGAAIDGHDMGLFRRILQTLADPNLAFLFMSIGTLGVIYELASPGAGVGGVIGGVMIILGLFSLAVLPISAVGLLFLALAFVLFVAELFAPGIGVFGFLGAGSLVLSGLFLFDGEPALDVSLAVLLPTAIVVGVAIVGAGRLALRTRHAPASTTGYGPLIDRTIRVGLVDGERVSALVDGAWWTVRTDGPVEVGDELVVRSVEGLTLVAEPPTDRDDRDPRAPGRGRSDPEQEGTRDG